VVTENNIKPRLVYTSNPPYRKGDLLVDTVGGGTAREHRVLRCERAPMVIIEGFSWKVFYATEDGDEAAVIVGDNGRDPFGRVWPMKDSVARPRVMAVVRSSSKPEAKVGVPYEVIFDALHDIVREPGWEDRLDDYAEAWQRYNAAFDEVDPREQEYRLTQRQNDIFDAEKAIAEHLRGYWVDAPQGGVSP
jgi:hypothetical protein